MKYNNNNNNKNYNVKNKKRTPYPQLNFFQLINNSVQKTHTFNCCNKTSSKHRRNKKIKILKKIINFFFFVFSYYI